MYCRYSNSSRSRNLTISISARWVKTTEPMMTVRILASTVCQCQDRCYSLSQFHHHLRCQTGLRDAPAPALLCRAILTGLWSELPPELVSHWATTTSLTWIMQMTLSSSLTKWMTFIVPWRFLRQRRRNSAYMYLGRKRRSRIWVRVNLHLAYQFAATRWKK